MKKSILALFLIICLMFTLISCGGETSKEIKTETLKWEKNQKFGGAYICITIEDFCKLGFEYGDSVELAFSNGVIYNDLPFYNGYYTRIGDNLICAYRKYPYIYFTSNFGKDVIEESKLDENTTAVIRLKERGKYKIIQDTLGMSYTDNREDYSSDEVFANFRSASGGKLKKNMFYRSASPCDNKHNRAKFVDTLCQQANIQCFIDLADNDDEIKSYMEKSDFNSPYWLSLYQNGKVLPIDMSGNYHSEKNTKKVIESLKGIISNQGPFLIHCTEGKDRTGLLFIILEALADATLQEIEADYMITYNNYYGINKIDNPTSYEAITDIYFTDMILFLSGSDNISKVNDEVMKNGVENYLSKGGMTVDEINQLKGKITAK